MMEASTNRCTMSGLASTYEVLASIIVDGVSFAPHTFPNVAALNADVYLFSLYKTFSVHQGLMVVRRELVDELPNQGHYFNEANRGKRLTPAGPDHGQIAAAGAVIDYVEELAAHHGIEGDLAAVTAEVGKLWRDHEARLLAPLLDALRELPGVRLLGGDGRESSSSRHRCPTVALALEHRDAGEVATALAGHRIMAGAGHFYAKRLVEALGVQADPGVLRLSFVHYTSEQEVQMLTAGLEKELG